MIRNESDVRDALREVYGRERIIRIEQASGSTFGVPDIMIPMQEPGKVSGRLFPIELKAGTAKGDTLTYSLRPSQVKFFRMMELLKCPAALVVGIIGTDRILVVDNTDESRAGKLELPFNGSILSNLSTGHHEGVREGIRMAWKYMTLG